MDSSNHAGDAIIDRAIEWIERLKDSAAPSEAFFDWLTESPRHLEVFMQALTLQQRIAGIGSEDWARLNQIAGNTLAKPVKAENVVTLRGGNPPPRQFLRRYRPFHAAVAAGIAALAALGWLTFAFDDWQDYETTVGEQRTLSLADGSLVNLNTGSHIEVRISAQGRDIRLIAGEALFKVQQDNRRPFRVHARDTVIQALGTQFNVYSRGRNTTVSVLEGRVRVSARALSAGEQVDVGGDGHIVRHTRLNTERVTAWQRRRLIFDEDTLATIVAEFNRYNRRQFHIADSTIDKRRFSGIFDADDPDSLALLLSRDAGLVVDRDKATISVRRR